MKNILIITFLFCLSTAHILAQEKVRMELKNDVKPDVYIDGKKYDHSIFDLLDQSKIESMFVIKDEQAIKKYNAPNGVIIIKTKNAAKQTATTNESKIKIRGTDNKEPIVILNGKAVGKEPVVVLDGKVVDKDTLSKLSPNDIESIEVLKGEKAIDQYNAPNGVIIVKTKN